MANPPLILLLFLLLLLHITTVHSLSSNIERWCRHMPHPASCRNHLSHATAPPPLLTHSDFYKLSLKAALDLAIHAQTRVKKLGSSCQGPADKTAWLDCCQLYSNTVLQLNRTLSRDNKSFVDDQTWLSAALTNLNTCDKGFAELRANASFMRPVLRYKLSDLVSNCLAINNVSFDESDMGLSWVMEGEGGVDFVVAQDGSGDFRSVGEAVEAAGELRKSRKRRIVIHVEGGVYAEYLVIGSGVYDLTIKGDGKGKTIITGQRSVALGYTTFNCPTVSKTLFIFFMICLWKIV